MQRRRIGRRQLFAGVALIVLTMSMAAVVRGEGSGTIYRGNDATRFRSHLEWRTATYGGGVGSEFVLRRRTLLKLYVQQGETILLGSSGIGVGGALNNGDIRVFNPGQVDEKTLGQEIIPALAGTAVPAQDGAFANGFSCLAQRVAAGDARGRITSRAQELAGPLPTAGGYNPCIYVAPISGIYNLVFTGPAGDAANTEPQVSGVLNLLPADFGVGQQTSVSAWDATVRGAGGTNLSGRLFTYYYTGNTGGGGRPVGGGGFVVTKSGFRYRLFFAGDPFGYVLYANQFGFRNSDGTPLYRNVLSDPTVGTQSQNELRQLQGTVALKLPEYPIFVDEPDELVLDALGIPREPVAPGIRDLNFAGSVSGDVSSIGSGGAFSFTATQPGVYYVVVSRDGASVDPTDPRNRVLRGVATAAGPVTVPWDGRDNGGDVFPAGEHAAVAATQGGEVHFPFLDVENNIDGGPVIELVNAPDLNSDGVGDCPPWNGGCFGAFYDDRGYTTADGQLIGTAVNGPLCLGNAQNPRGFGNPPLVAASDPVRGFDTRTTQRGFGFPGDANPAGICQANGGFGDKKGLDLWTYYPSNVLRVPLRILAPTAATLRSLTVSRTSGQVVVRWETSGELGTQGFHVLRSTSGGLADATRLTPTLIAAQGSALAGTAYSWVDAAAPARGAATYWLQEVGAGGRTQLYGPVRLGTPEAPSRYTIGLPLLMQ